jgi:hypothetical protein
MTDIMGDEWDLSEVIAERIQPEDEVSFYLDEYSAYVKSQLVEKLGKATPEEKPEIEAELEQINATLKAKKYTVHLKGTPSRMREDAHSKALAAYPVKNATLMTDENASARVRYENDILWHMHITDVVNGSGGHKQNWSLEEIQGFATNIPTSAQNLIDAAIKKLATRVNEFTIASQDSNF